MISTWDMSTSPSAFERAQLARMRRWRQALRANGPVVVSAAALVAVGCGLYVLDPNGLVGRIGSALITSVITIVVGVKYLERAWKQRFEKAMKFKPVRYRELLVDLEGAAREFVMYTTFSYLFCKSHQDDEPDSGERMSEPGALCFEAQRVIGALLERHPSLTVRILLLDPYCAAARQRSRERAEAGESNVHSLMKENLQVVKAFCERQKEANAERLHIRVYDVLPRFQYHRLDDACVAAFYPPDRAASDPSRTQAHFDRDTAAGQIFERGFEQVWEVGRSLQLYWETTVEIVLRKGDTDFIGLPRHIQVRYCSSDDDSEMWIAVEAASDIASLRSLTHRDDVLYHFRKGYPAENGRSWQANALRVESSESCRNEFKGKYGSLASGALCFALSKSAQSRSLSAITERASSNHQTTADTRGDN